MLKNLIVSQNILIVLGLGMYIFVICLFSILEYSKSEYLLFTSEKWIYYVITYVINLSLKFES